MTPRKPATAASAPPPEVMAARRDGELLVPEQQVRAAVDRLSVRLSLRLQHANPLILTVLTGGLPLAGALLPRLAFPLEVGCVHVGRYRDALHGGELEWHARPAYDLAGRVVLFVDDVLDEGKTLAALVDWARAQGAVEVLSAVLVDKQVTVDRPVQADFAALTCPDRYLFGCGMDFRGYWRNLPAIYALPPELERSG